MYVSAFAPSPRSVTDAKWFEAYQAVEYRNPDTYSVNGYVGMQAMAEGAANTPLGVMHGIDFDIEQHDMVYDEPWRGRLERKEITPEQAAEAARTYLNVVQEHRFVLAAVKDR